MDWSSFIAPGVVGALLGLYLKSISQRIDEVGKRLDVLQTEVTSLGKGVARIEGRLDPYDRTTNSPSSE